MENDYEKCIGHPRALFPSIIVTMMHFAGTGWITFTAFTAGIIGIVIGGLIGLAVYSNKSTAQFLNNNIFSRPTSVNFKILQLTSYYYNLSTRTQWRI